MISVLAIKKVNNAGSLKAFVKLKIDDTVINDFRIVQQEGQSPWVSVPQVNWTGTDGKVHYKNLVELPKNLKDEVSREILESWKN